MTLTDLIEAAGITRDELRALVLERQAERDAAEQRRVDAELLRLGEEFKRDTHDRRREPQPRRTVAEMAAAREKRLRPLRLVPPPPLIETEHCAAFQCENAPEVELVRVYAGRPLRVRYCQPHADEVREELAVADGK